MTFELSLLATPKAVPELRHHLRHHSYEVRLCASELVTNAIDHLGEGTPVTVRVIGTAHGHVRVEVTDPDPRALPVLLHATDTDESGRGLALLDALAQRWGVEQLADRKTVWCELAGQAQRPARDPRSQAGRSGADGYLP
ncbi:ATP-binding protein [Streptomyces sp. NBC_01352]|uniref:ATP-binding protein n=1 Tax=unclassified Streptomyces TaxID=2593676 RepID=UPI0022576AD5|nr:MULTISPECIES: ATP-binding protein [unclassified Streptomyces]MCX4698286.1 ATP-binding protein [Streptomyces sp. NBC_01373]